jgi:hypothetical protein
MKPWEIIAEDLSKARRAGHLCGNQKRFWRDPEWQRIGNQMNRVYLCAVGPDFFRHFT